MSTSRAGDDRSSHRAGGGGQDSAASNRPADLLAAFHTCAAAHALDGVSDAHIRAFNQRLAAAFPFTCRRYPAGLGGSPASTPSAHSRGPGSYPGAQPHRLATPPAAPIAEEEMVVRLTPASRASSERTGASPAGSRRSSPPSVARSLAVVKQPPPGAARAGGSGSGGDGNDAGGMAAPSTRSRALSPTTRGARWDEAAVLQEALVAVHAVLDTLRCFLRESVRTVATAPEPYFTHIFHEDSSSDGDDTLGSSVILGSSSRLDPAPGTGVGFPASSSAYASGGGLCGTLRSASVRGEDSATTPALPSGASVCLDAAVAAPSTGASSPQPPPLAGLQSAQWHGVLTVCTALCRFMRAHVFGAAAGGGGAPSEAPCSPCDGPAGRSRSRSRSTSPSPSAGAGRVQSSRPSASVRALRQAVLAYVQAQVLQGVHGGGAAADGGGACSPPPQGAAPGVHAVSSPRAGRDVEHSRGGRPTEADMAIRRAVVPWWVWAISTMGIAEDPVFLERAGSGAQTGMGFLVAVADQLAMGYVRAQLRTGAAFDLATFLSLSNVEVPSVALADASLPPASGTCVYDGATFAAVTALDSAANMSDSLSVVDQTHCGTTANTPCLLSTTIDHPSASRSSRLSPQIHSGRSNGRATAVAVVGGGAGAFASSARAPTSSPSPRDSRGVPTGESGDAYTTRVMRSVMRDLRSGDHESEELASVSVNVLSPPRASRRGSPARARPPGSTAASLPMNASWSGPRSVLGRGLLSHGGAQECAWGRSPGETARAPRLSRIAQVEQVVSGAGKAIQFGVKLGALYATQDMNALLSLLPSSSSSATAGAGAAPPPLRTMRPGEGGAGATRGPHVVGPTSGSPPASARTERLSPVEEEARSVAGAAPRSLLDPHVYVGPRTGSTTPSVRGPSGVGGAASPLLGGHGRSMGEAGASWGAGVRMQLRTGERRARLRDLDDYANDFFASLRSPSALMLEPEVPMELSLCLSLILLNRIATSAIAAATAAAEDPDVPAITCDLLGFSAEVWPVMATSLTETCVCALLRCLERQHVVLAQELTDFLAVLVWATVGTAAGRSDAGVPQELGVMAGVSDGNPLRPDSLPWDPQPTDGETQTPSAAPPPPPSSRVPCGLRSSSITLHSIFPRMWLTGFTQVSDMAKHLLSCGHGSPKTLESATWYLAGMSDYLVRVRLLMPGHAGPGSASLSASAVGQRQAAARAEAAMEVLREVILNSNSYFKAIVGFMEALADVFTRDMAGDRDGGSDGDLGDLEGERSHRARTYRRRAGLGTDAYGDDDEGGDVYGAQRSRRHPSVSAAVVAHNGQPGDDVEEVPTLESHRNEGNGADASEGGGSGGVDADDPLKAHYRLMELCVHYFLEIFDVLMEASLSLQKKPLFLYALVVSLACGGSLDDSYPNCLSATAARRGSPGESHTGPGFSEAAAAAAGGTRSVTSRLFCDGGGSGGDVDGEDTDAEAADDPLCRLKYFLDRYCSTVLQGAVGGKFSLDTDLLVASGLMEAPAKPGSGGGGGGFRVTPMEEDYFSATNRSLSFSAVAGGAAEGLQPADARSAESSSRGGGFELFQAPAGGWAGPWSSGRRAWAVGGPPRQPSTMWWPSQPFQPRRHVLRVAEHARLIAVFLQESPACAMRGHTGGEEQDCQRGQRRRRCQAGGAGLVFSGVSALLDTASGPCTQLLSLPCGRPILSSGGGGGGGGAGGGAGNSAASSLTNPPLTLPGGAGRTLLQDRKGGSAGPRPAPRATVTSDRALLSVCGGLWLRVQLLRLLSAASVPMDRAQARRFSRHLLRSTADPCDRAGVLRHYRAMGQLVPLSFSVLPGTASATYVRLLVLRIVQGFYSARHAAAMEEEEAGGVAGRLSPALCQAVGRLWACYVLELLRALGQLCWHHAEAHRTATTLSIPSVLSRFLQVLMEEEVAGWGDASYSRPHPGSHDDEEEDVGLTLKPFGVDRTDEERAHYEERARNFRDFEDDDDDDDEGGERVSVNGEDEETALEGHEGRHTMHTKPPSEDATGTVDGSRDIVSLSQTLELRSSTEAVRTWARPSTPPLPRQGLSKAGEDTVKSDSGTMAALATLAPPPMAVPRLSLVGLGPPLYYASSGDTGAAQEAMILQTMPAHLPEPAGAGPRGPRDGTTPKDVDRESRQASPFSPQLRDGERPPTPRSDPAGAGVAFLEESLLGSAPSTPVPRPASPTGGARVGQGRASGSLPPAVGVGGAAAFAIPRLCFADLGPALYFASSGDTGAFMESSMLHPSVPHTATTTMTTTTPTPSTNTYTGPPPTNAAGRAGVGVVGEAQPPSALRGLSSQGGDETATAAPSESMSPRQEPRGTGAGGGGGVLPREAGQGEGRRPVVKTRTGRTGPTLASTLATRTAPTAGLGGPTLGSSPRQDTSAAPPSSLPSILTFPKSSVSAPAGGQGGRRRSRSPTATTDDRAGGEGVYLRRIVPPLGAAPGSAVVSPPMPMNPDIVAELILCITRAILQRDSGFIQYGFTVSSLTQKRAHVTGAAIQPRMLYGVLLDMSARSHGGRRPSDFGTGGGGAAAAAAPHAPSTYHVLQSLSQYLLSRRHAAVAAILEQWLNDTYGTLAAELFAREVVRRPAEGAAVAGADWLGPESVRAARRCCPPFTIGQMVLLRLLLPRRRWLRNFVAKGRLGSGGFGSVLAVTYVPRDDTAAGSPTGTLSRSPMCVQPLAKTVTPPPAGAHTPPPSVRRRSSRYSAADEGVLQEAIAAHLERAEPDLAAKLMPLRLQGSESGALPVSHSEAVAMLRLRAHPHISTAISFGCSSREYYLITPAYTAGSLLSWRLQTYPPGCAPITPFRYDSEECFNLFSLCARAFEQVLEAVAYAHRHRIRHGDIKADNIFVSQSRQVIAYDRSDDDVGETRAPASAHGETGEGAAAAGAGVKRSFPMCLVQSIRLGDFGSCDSCEDEDMRALLRDLEAGEGRFLSGRWGSGKGTEAIQPPEVMVPKRRYEVLCDILHHHHDLRLRRKAARAARPGTVAGSGPNVAGSGGAASAVDTAASSSTLGLGPAAAWQVRSRGGGDEEEGGDVGTGHMDALLADLRRAELSVDVWACGCLLYEMLTGRMLFGEGRLGRLGVLAGNRRSGPLPQSPHSARTGADGLLWDRDDLLPHVDETVVGFLSQLLRLEPMQRPTAEEALHVWRDIVAHHKLMPPETSAS